MEADNLAIMLLVLGLALLVAEFFVPSGGMITVMAVVSLLSSVWFAWKAWGTSSPTTWWSFLITLIISLPVTLGGTLFLISNTRLGRRVLLEAPSLDEVTPHQAEQRRLQQLIGQRGRTLTLLNPGGLVLVNGERIHSESPGLMLDPDIDVEVIAVKGTRIVVAPARAAAASTGDVADEAPAVSGDAWLAEEAGSPPKAATADRDRLDFDLGDG